MTLRTSSLLLILVVGCGKSDKPADKPADKAADKSADTKAADKPAPAPTPSAPADDRCEVKVEGDVTATAVHAGGPGAVGTDYWMSKDELHQAVAMLQKDPAKVEEAMKKDPVFYLLLMNCGGGDVGLSFFPNMTSKYADVPFAPKKSVFGTKPGDYTALLSLSHKGYMPDPGGTFDVTKFDKTGISGTFAFEATGMSKKDHVKVSGTFNYKCGEMTSVCREGK